jgi:hypothetical protein
MNQIKKLAFYGVAVAVAAFARPVWSQGDSDDSKAGKLEGTWQVTVSVNNCSTGPSGPPFRSLLTFARGGTLTGTTANPAFQPGQRSPDHGVWAPAGGRAFRSVEEAFILFDSPPNPPQPAFQKGTQRISQTIELKNEDEFSSNASVTYYDVDGNVLIKGCATAEGQRFK